VRAIFGIFTWVKVHTKASNEPRFENIPIHCER
jgi:hypothetical protein